MSSRQPYSRIYWSIFDDERFAAIRADVRHLGSWMVMLLVADMAYPASAFVPPIVPRASLSLLIDAGLIDSQTGGMYRIHGLQAERNRRADAARRGPNGDPTGTQTGLNGDPDGSQDETRRGLAEPSLAEDETGIAAFDALDVFHELTGWRPWGQWSGDSLKGAIRDYGGTITEAALRAEYVGDKDRGSLLKRTLTRLARDADRQREDARARPRRLPPKKDAKIEAEIAAEANKLWMESVEAVQVLNKSTEAP